MGMPDFKDEFPSIDQNLKIRPDLLNRKHCPHFDIVQSIEDGAEGRGGTDQIRVSPNGTILGGTTNIAGMPKLDWP